jgi:hypothetical protein
MSSRRPTHPLIAPSSLVFLSGRCDRGRSSLAFAYGLSYRDIEELLAERGTVVDYVTVHR